MDFTPNEILAAFQGPLAFNFRVMRETYRVRSFELLPDPASILHIEDAQGEALPLHLPTDRVIGLQTLIKGQWDRQKQDYLGQILDNFPHRLTLIDVGSNIGLFSRQCLNRIKRIDRLYCYEPNPANFGLLRRNVAGPTMIELNNYGLSNAAGTLDFHVDPDNVGNCSLHEAALSGDHQIIQVEIRGAYAESHRWMQDADAHFLYKSDTQGFDEIISTSIDPAFWPRVKAGIFELWRLPGKAEYDVDRFVSILDAFPNKVFEKAPRANVSSRDVLAYLDSVDRDYDDLYFWR